MESFVIDQEFEEDPQVEAAKFLLNPEEDRSVDPETQARLEALLQAAGKQQNVYLLVCLVCCFWVFCVVHLRWCQR